LLKLTAGGPTVNAHQAPPLNSARVVADFTCQ
jgi:hypothetical protein